METFNIQSWAHRKWPDPNNHLIEHHMFLGRCIDVDTSIKPGANPRTQNEKTTNKKVGKEVRATLLNIDQTVDNAFHHKNRGINVVASKVTKRSEKDGFEQWTVQYDPEAEGNRDGYGTQTVIRRAREQGEDISSGQYVYMFVSTNLPKELITESSHGHNTSMTVQPKSFADHEHKFDWIKETLKNEPYYNQIAWKETDEGEYDIEFILQLMFMMNINIFPNLEDSHPTSAYSSKSSVFRMYEKDYENKLIQFKSVKPILKDMLRLYETITCGAPGSGGYMDVKLARTSTKITHKSSKKIKFHIIDEESDEVLNKALAFPIFAAFRWYVQSNGSGFKWKNDDFDAVLSAWNNFGGEMLKFCALKLTQDFDDKFSSLGKASLLWLTLHSKLATKFDLRS